MGHSPRGLGPASTESHRLVEGGATAKERVLLQAGIDDAPPSRAGRRRTLAALGIAASTSAVASSATATVVSKVVALGQAKWLLFSAVSAALAVGTLELATRSDSVPLLAPSVLDPGRKATTASKSVSPIENATPPMPSPSRLVPRVAPPPIRNDAPATAALSSRPSSEQGIFPVPRVELSPSPPAEAVPSPSELVEQVAALDRARATLHAGRAGESLSLLDRFDQSYPHSSLRPEATVVRVSALLAIGQRAQATQLVRTYCRTGGGGAYGHRLMALVGLSESTCEVSGAGP